MTIENHTFIQPFPTNFMLYNKRKKGKKTILWY